jgi:eukaryotic-like serine/threonine-protein kinase
MTMSERELFIAALQLDPDQRPGYLDRECGGDTVLRQRVEELLTAHAETGSQFGPDGGAGSDEAASAVPPATEAAGSMIAGRYKLIEEIGEGGMGTVFMAQQVAPVKRAVAVKIVKAGMDSKAVLARFDAERQALAMMNHPNIARVLDAGSTESGRPFFVMELVKGIPITQYCDQRRLTPRQRLELFVPVCQAIQHAHQKGVIHRDIKPSNVLVAMYDDRAVPKVIDFGLAKAAGQALTEKTLMTGFGTLVGTPEYMSPEQASLNNLDIDTRSDVYSLGILLYELLTGSTPVDRKSLGAAAVLEVLRIVREVEAPRPSAKLSSSEALPSISANRSIEPARLTKLMRGELDWVLLKALEKDRTRRYETANALARDIERYLSDEVVEARPPGTIYRLKKFARRHKAQVLAGGLVLLALLAGITGTTFGLIRAEQQRTVAEQQRAEAERQQHRAEAGEKLAGDRLIQVEDEKKRVEAEKKKAEEEKQMAEAVRHFLQDKLLGQADTKVQANALLNAGGSSASATLNPTVRELLDRAALELAPDKTEANFPKQPLLQAELLQTVGDTYRGVGEFGKAIAFLARAAELRKACLGADHLASPDLMESWLTTLDKLATAYQGAGKRPQAIELFQQVRNARVKKLGAENVESLNSTNNLALVYLEAGMLPQAIELFEQARDGKVKLLGAEHPATLTTLDNLARANWSAGKLPQASALFEQVRDARMKKLGADHPDTLTTLNNLAAVYWSAGRLPEAVKLFEQVGEARVKKLGADHPETLATLNNLAVAYLRIGNLPRAISLFEEVSDARAKKLGAEHPETLATLGNLARAYQADGKLSRAIEILERVCEVHAKKSGTDHPDTLNALNSLAAAYYAGGKLPRAIELFEQVRDVQAAKLGADHPDTLSTLNNLAAAYQSAGKLPEAIRLFEQVRDAQVKMLGADHPDTLITLANLASGYRDAGKLTQAIALFQQVRDVQVKKLGPDHINTLATLNNLARAYRAAGQVPQAISLLEQIRDARVKKMGAEHPDTLVTFNDLAWAYQGAGKLPQAIELFEHVCDAKLKKSGPDHPETLNALNNLAFAYQAAGRLPQALPLFEQAARGIEKRNYVVENPAKVIFNTVSAYEAARQFDKAEDWRRKWLAFVKEKAGDGSPAYAAELAGLGQNLLRQKKYSEAESILRECLALREKLLKKKQAVPWQIAAVKSMLGEALLGQKKPDAAGPLLVAGYEGLKQDEKAIPQAARLDRMTEAIQRLIDLATAAKRPDDVKKWQAERLKYPAQEPAEKK